MVTKSECASGNVKADEERGKKIRNHFKKCIETSFIFTSLDNKQHDGLSFVK